MDRPSTDRPVRLLVTWLVVVLMVLSMTATSSAAPALTDGSAAGAADQTGPNRTVPYERLGGQRFWQNQRISVTGLDPDAIYEVRRVTGSRSSAWVRELGTDANGVLRVRTDGLQGSFFLRGPGIEGSEERDARFEIGRQTLTASWSSGSVRVGGSADLLVRSNRAEFVVAVSAPGLRFEDLRRVFAERHFAGNFDAREDDDVILLEVPGEADLGATFRDVRPGSYTFRVRVVDSAARATARVSVGESRQDVGFVGTSARSSVGDTARTTVRLANTRAAYLVLGGPDRNFLDVVEVTDRDGDGTVTLRMNTRYMGLDPNAPGVPPNVRPYRAVGPSDTARAFTGADRLATGTTLGQLRSSLGVADGLSRPLDPGDYRVVAATSSDVRREGNGLRIVDGRATATLLLGEASVDEARTLAAPRGSAIAGGVGALRRLSRRDAVALGDQVVLGFRLTGVFGHLAAEHGNGIAGLVGNRAEGIDLTVRQTTADPNRDPIRIDLGGPGVALRTDEANEQLYVVVDTRTVEASEPLAPGQSYRARLRLSGIDPSASPYDVRSDDSRAYHGYPYLRPGGMRNLTTTFRLSQRSAEFDGLVGDQIRVTPSRSVAISGTTNVAPGSALQIRTRATGEDPFVRTSTALVRPDGTWSVQQDFSNETVGRTFEASIRDSSGQLRSVQGRVVNSQTPSATPTATPEPTPTATPEPTASPTGSPTATDPPAATGTPSTTVGDGSGFGVVAALLSLVALALLTRRR